MPCFHPLTGFLEPGERVSFKPNGGREVSLPCGKCVGCRASRADQWATRVMHEASLHEHNCFLTLTYSDDHLPDNGGLRYRDYQLFMKRLRKLYPRARFYMCGEYGEQTKRPHYHAALFGVEFPDAVPVSKRPGGMIYTSQILSDLWPLGHSSFGALTRESAAYIARYVMKKLSGPPAEQAYRRVDPETGEVFQVEPEFNRMSLKPGIGLRWLERYHSDVFPEDAINTQGRLSKPPRYYTDKMEVINPDVLVTVSERRYRRALLSSEDNTAARLATKEKIAKARMAFKKRNLE